MKPSAPLAALPALLEAARQGRYAVGAFGFCNAETALAIAQQAAALRSPAILMTGPWELPLLEVELVVDIVRSMASRADVPLCLHLDHARDPQVIGRCIEAGFSSVMIDASRRDFEENVRITRAVVEMAHARGVAVEGELGAVGDVDGASVEGDGAPTLTDPALAGEFVRRTGVDALAVAIGNAHGVYRQRPWLDFDLLRRIRQATPAPLVLHGGSGTPADQLREAIAVGVTKVNIASELSRDYLEAMARALHTERVWYSHALGEAKAAFAQVAARWMSDLGSAGQAP